MPLTHTTFFDIFIFTYGAYSSAVERQIVDLVVVGSIPTRHPFIFNAPVAHLDRAPDFESGGRRFESSQTHSIKGAQEYELLFNFTNAFFGAKIN